MNDPYYGSLGTFDQKVFFDTQPGPHLPLLWQRGEGAVAVATSVGVCWDLPPPLPLKGERGKGAAAVATFVRVWKNVSRLKPLLDF